MTGVAFLNAELTNASDIPNNVMGFTKVRVSRSTGSRRLAGVFVVFTVALAPIPAGGNHPLAWLFWSTVIGFFAAVLAATSTTPRQILTKNPRQILKLGAVFCAFAVFQSLPFPGLSGGLSLDLPKTSVVTKYLSIAPGASILASLRIVGYLLFFVLVLFAAQDIRHARMIGQVLFLTVAGHAVFALISLQFTGGINLTGSASEFPRAATGTFVNKNSFATFLGMGLMLGLSRVLSNFARANPMYRVDQIVTLIGLAVVLIALFMTQSRMGIGVSLVASLVVIVNSPSQKAAKLALSTAGVSAAFLFVSAVVQTGFLDLGVSAQTRLDLYSQMLGMIADRPLVGFGLDSFSLAFEPFHSAPVTAEFVWDKGHSTYLTLWVETGVLIGSIPPLMGLIAMRGLWQRSRARERGRSLGLAGLAALILVALHSIGDFSLEIQANLFLLIAIVALGLADNRSRKGHT